jgi:hypothetical protein
MSVPTLFMELDAAESPMTLSSAASAPDDTSLSTSAVVSDHGDETDATDTGERIPCTSIIACRRAL